MNVMLGFNRKEEDEYEWDKVGKNFEKEFTILIKNEEIRDEEHTDSLIDIREFYP